MKKPDIRWWLEWRRYVLISAVVAILAYMLAYYPFRNNPVLSAVFQTVGSTLISTGTVGLLFEFIGRQNLGAIFDVVRDQAETGIQRVFHPADQVDWLDCIEGSTVVTLVGVRLKFIKKREYREALKKVLQKEGGEVTLITSDPRSLGMWLRYNDEPHSLNWTSKQELWDEGLEEIAGIQIFLDRWKQDLKNSGQDVSRLTLKIFPHYPTYAISVFDDKLFVYHFPYMEPGNRAPSFLFKKSSNVGEFLSSCLNRITNDSILLENAITEIRTLYEAGEFKDAKVLNTPLPGPFQK